MEWEAGLYHHTIMVYITGCHRCDSVTLEDSHTVRIVCEGLLRLRAVRMRCGCNPHQEKWLHFGQ